MSNSGQDRFYYSNQQLGLDLKPPLSGVAKQNLTKIRLISSAPGSEGWVDVEVTPDQLMFLDWLVARWNEQVQGPTEPCLTTKLIV